jgi:hypothetical protein
MHDLSHGWVDRLTALHDGEGPIHQASDLAGREIELMAGSAPLSDLARDRIFTAQNAVPHKRNVTPQGA